jgi:segregation and condensation protein A
MSERQPIQEEIPFRAIVDGKPYEEIPKDLYIPPEALDVILDTFEGPLDLLLYLIRKQNIDILNIPILKITQQYMTYISVDGGLELEFAAEYLLMAALLAEIKSRLLLPRKVKQIEESEDDPGAVLIRRLQEYEKIKNVAEALDDLPRMERDITLATIDTSLVKVQRPQAEVQFQDIVFALQGVLTRANQLSHHVITKEPLLVKDRMNHIMLSLQSQSCVLFEALFTAQEGRAGVVVSFLAILELSKAEMIEITQAEPFSELSIRAKALRKEVLV